MEPLLKIGLTGGLGAGKSAVLAILQRMGVPVLQTDLVGHKVLQDPAIQRRLVREWGPSIRDGRGGVDRKAIARLVFEDPRKLRFLNRSIHPAVRKGVALWMKAQKKGRFSFLVVEVPLLFERGYNRAFDKVLSVSAPRAARRRRLARRGWESGEILRRERAQWSQTRKDREADWVLSNGGSKKELASSVSQWVRKVQDLSVHSLGRGRGSD